MEKECIVVIWLQKNHFDILFSTLIMVIKKIIIHKNAKGISNPNEVCLSAKRIL